MDDNFNFLQAGLNETIYSIPDDAKVTISANNINSIGIDNSGPQTIIIYDPLSGTELTDEFNQTLQNVITSIKIDRNHITILNNKISKNIHIQQLIKKQSTLNIICFGLQPGDLGIRIETEKYRCEELNGLKMIFCDHLENMTKSLKSKLWGELQNMYGIKTK